ncbi:MAG: threonine synthase [Pseudomonadota bacterium]
MRYISTRGQAPVLGFEDTLLAGLARDGGLYLPESYPTLSADEIRAMRGLPYEEVAFRVMWPFLGGAFGEGAFRGLIGSAYASFRHPARCPLVQTGPNDWILELHHGPTLAFKDFAMQLVAQMFEAVLEDRGSRTMIVCATSGDTGSAAMEAFRGLERVRVVVLYPHGRVSEVQRRQMTTPTEGNVHAFAVDGTFDDCQALVKAMFNDHGFRDEMHLGAVNSINWGRVLAQVVYYFAAAAALGAPDRVVDFSVPTGNFGDILAGDVARRMGLPVGRLVIATNENDILHRTLAEGIGAPEPVVPTIAPSMDIQVSSNFERLLFELYGRDGDAVAKAMADQKAGRALTLPQGALDELRRGFASDRASRAETIAVIRRLREETGLVIDPHTAIGVKAAETCRRDAATPMITLGTAHAAKFPEAVEEGAGVHPALPPHMADLFEREERITRAPNDLQTVETMIRDRCGMVGAGA